MSTRSLAGRAVLALGLFVGFYLFAAVVVVVLLLLLWLQLAVFRGGSYVILGGILACALGAVSICWAVIPRPDHFEAPGPRLTKKQQPRLFAMLAEVAKAAHQQVPSEVYLVREFNAWVTYRGGLMGIGSRKVMGIGFPLLHVLSEPEVRSVLAHEFGHYDRTLQFLAPWVYKTYAAIARTIAALDSHNSYFAELFEFYGEVFLRLTRPISRQQELEADRLAWRLTSPAVFASAMVRIEAGGLAYADYWATDMAPVVKAGLLPPLGEGFRSYLAHPEAMERAMTRALADIEHSELGLFDTHPSTRERLAAAQQAASAPVEPVGEPAIALLEQADDLEAKLILQQFNHTWLREAEAVSWDAVGNKVWVPSSVTCLREYAGTLSRLNVAALPDALSDVDRLAAQLNVTGTLVSASVRAQRTIEVVGRALAVALAEVGWDICTLPGDTPRAVRRNDGATLLPLVAVERLAKGALSADQWQGLCAQLGIGDVRLRSQQIQVAEQRSSVLRANV